MNSKLIVILVSLLLLCSCSDKSTENTDNSNINGKLISIGPCDQTQTFAEVPECLTYEYDGKILTIVHHDVWYNCCKDIILGNISFNQDSIIITESEITPNPCRCNCRYDLTYRVNNIKSGKYLIIFKADTYTIELIADLVNNKTGKFCKKS